MKTKFIYAIACILACSNVGHAQTNTFPTTGNVGIGTLTPAKTMQVVGSSRLGGNTNYAQFDGSGNLTFNGSGTYMVGSNKYAFQFANNTNYGLFFNSSDVHYEFRNGSATPVFYVGADSGQGVFSGGVSVGSNILPPTNGLYVSGKLGIGINNPDAKLHVTGGTNITLGGGGTIVAGPLTATNLAIDNDEIQARNNGAASVLHFNQDGGDVNFNSGAMFLKSTNNFVGIGTTTPAVPLNVLGGFALSLNGGGTIVAGATNTYNLGISSGAIQARNNGAASLLSLNSDGGDVNISRGALFVDGSNNFVGIGAAPSAQFHVVLGKDATLTDGGYIVAGPTTFNNIAIDAKGIQARNNGNAAELFLNRDGGTIETGGDLLVGGGEIDMENSKADFGGFELINNFVVGSIGDFVAGSDNNYLLGNSSHRWLEVWSADGSINTSDERDKKNIRDLNYGLKEIMQLRSVKFNWKNSSNQNDKLGLIAQDLQKVLPEVVRDYEYKTDKQTGKTEKIPTERLGVMYADIIPVLIKAIQEQQKEIDELKKSTGNAPLTNAAPSVAEVKTIKVKLSTASLEQNIPNPLRNTTSIRYNIPVDIKNASLVITDMSGKAIKQISVKAGSGVINIDASSLNTGTYNYTLIADGRTIETKRMVVAK